MIKIEPTGFYTTIELSEMLHLHPVTIRGWLRSGKLKGVKVGRRYMAKGFDVIELLEGKTTSSQDTLEESNSDESAVTSK